MFHKIGAFLNFKWSLCSLYLTIYFEILSGAASLVCSRKLRIGSRVPEKNLFLGHSWKCLGSAQGKMYTNPAVFPGTRTEKLNKETVDFPGTESISPGQSRLPRVPNTLAGIPIGVPVSGSAAPNVQSFF